jgi:surfeit locus 1 family protein
MKPLELTRRGVIGTLAVLVVAAVCVRLGIWQLHRLDERQARNAVIAERMDQPPVELTSAPRDTTLAYRRARITGEIDDDRALILAGRSRNGAPGVQLLSPVRIGDGAVLVDRGWLPSPDAATIDLDAVRLSGRIRVEGMLLPFPPVRGSGGSDGFRVTWFRFHGDDMRAQYPYPVAPLYLLATSRPGEPGDADDAAAPPTEAETIAPIPLDPPSLDSGPHLSYAIQWFSFAAIFIIGWVVLLVRHNQDDED